MNEARFEEIDTGFPVFGTVSFALFPDDGEQHMIEVGSEPFLLGKESMGMACVDPGARKCGIALRKGAPMECVAHECWHLWHYLMALLEDDMEHGWMDAAGELYAYSFGRLFESVRRRFTS